MNKIIKFSTDKPTCNCGVFGIEGSENDLPLTTYFGLHALQHRGQEASGIVKASQNGDGIRKFKTQKGFGLVADVFTTGNMLNDDDNCRMSIGHNRYSTFGSSDSRNNFHPYN